MSAKHRTLLAGSTLAILAVLFVAVIVITNMLFRGARVDLTDNDLYTLSDGTRQVLTEIDEPINLYFFWSDRGSRDLAPLRNYATRVRELLEEVAAASKGKVNLEIIDPLPFSEEEDRAASYGLQAVPINNAGETIYFGLVGTNATDGQMIVPFFQPDKEGFLEYDLAKLIHGLTTSTKPVVGVISSLQLGPSLDETTRQMKPGWAIHQSLQELFEVRSLNDGTTTKIDDEIKTLVLVHPKEVSDDLAYAIDQFVLKGGKLIVFLDPHAELDDSGTDPSNPTSAMFANKSSDLPKLLKAWGVDYDPTKVLIDARHGLTVQGGDGRPVRHLGILGFAKDSMNQQDVVSSQLESVNVSTAGVVRLAEGSPLQLAPLIQSSADSMLIDGERVKFLTDPGTLFEGFVPSKQNYVVAGRLTGKLKTAFPEKTGPEHVAETNFDVNMIVVADTDMLADRLWVQTQQFFGQTIMNAFANNGDFAVNAVDNLTGSSALIAVRSRAASARPFTKVAELRRSADDRFRLKEQELNKQLAETEQKLNELQRGKSAETAMILSPEQKVELERFQEQKVKIRKELRQVRRQLDADIESLGSRLKFYNIALVPLLLTFLALGYMVWRRRRAA